VGDVTDIRGVTGVTTYEQAEGSGIRAENADEWPKCFNTGDFFTTVAIW